MPYIDGSYSKLVEHYCIELGYDPIMIDPFTSSLRGPFKAVALLAHSASTTYKYTNQQHEDQLYCILQAGSVIVDPWRKFERKSNEYQVIHYGNTRQVA